MRWLQGKAGSKGIESPLPYAKNAASKTNAPPSSSNPARRATEAGLGGAAGSILEVQGEAERNTNRRGRRR